MSDIDAWREVAEAATPGEWQASGWDTKLLITKRWAQEEQDPDGRGPWMAVQACFDEDAAFVETFDPPTILSILDRLEAAEAKAERVEALLAGWRVGGDAMLTAVSQTPDLPRADTATAVLLAAHDELRASLDGVL